MKKTVFYVLAGALIALASCSKKEAASMGELDGTWNVTEGTSKSTSKDYDSKGSLESTTTYDVKYTGSKVTGTSVYTPTNVNSKSTSNSIDGDWSYKITFDKKEGTYEKITVTSDKNQSVGYAYYKADKTSIYCDVITVTKTTTTEKGLFALNSKSGDVAKGSEVILTPNSSDATTNTTYTYYETKTTTVLTGLLQSDNYSGRSSDTFKNAPTSETTTSKGDYSKNSDAEILTIVEATKKDMSVIIEDINNSSSTTGVITNGKSEFTSTTEFTFEKE